MRLAKITRGQLRSHKGCECWLRLQAVFRIRMDPGFFSPIRIRMDLGLKVRIQIRPFINLCDLNDGFYKVLEQPDQK